MATQDLDGNWLYDPGTQVVFSNRRQSKGKKYSFDYVRASYTPAGAARRPSRWIRTTRSSGSSPTCRRCRWSRSWSAELTQGKQTNYDKVRAIYDYFSRQNGFSYSLSTQGGTSGQDIVNFLTNKVGFCQQYAAAMAWLVRAADIPARVAFGFTLGNKQGNTYTLTNLNLHAWTEVYFEGVGWVPFDATPAANVTGSTRTDWAPDTDAPEPVAPATVPTAAPGVDPTAVAGPDDRLDRGFDDGLTGGGGTLAPTSATWPWWTAGGVLALLALLAVPGLRRSALRRRRQLRATAATTAASVGGDPPPGVARVVVSGVEADRARADAHAAWEELIDTMVDFRVPVDPDGDPPGDRRAAGVRGAQRRRRGRRPVAGSG